LKCLSDGNPRATTEIVLSLRAIVCKQLAKKDVNRNLLKLEKSNVVARTRVPGKKKFCWITVAMQNSQ